MKKSTSKLTLNRETLTRLETALQKVVGGAGNSGHYTCVSYANDCP
jgi:hypothetical protein